jgi:hypothetical protein
MIETRALAQEVQDQLLAAMHRGHDQFRKSQKQIRRSQYHLRKSREAMAEAIRSSNQVAKAIRPLSDPADRAKLRADALELADQLIATQRQLADRALQVTGPLAEQVIATQRQLADRALQVTGPLAEQVIATQRQLATRAMQSASPAVADRVAKLTHAVGTLPGMRRLGLADGVAAGGNGAADETSRTDFIAEVREIRPTSAAGDAGRGDETSTTDFIIAAESPAPRAKASKPRTPRASTTRADGQSKPRATGTAGATRSTGTAKPRTTKAAGTARTARTSKPRSTKN